MWCILKDVVLLEKPREWDRNLGSIRLNYNNTPHGTIGVSPYQLTFGHEGATKLAELRSELLAWAKPTVDVKLTKSDERYLEDSKEDLKRVQEVADEVALRAQREYVGHYNKRAKIKEFKVGDQVLVLRPSSTIALKAHWIGPCTVEEAVVANAYWVRFPDGGRKCVQASQLRHFVARVDQVGIVFDDEQSFGKIETCPSSDDVLLELEDRFDRLDLRQLSLAA